MTILRTIGILVIFLGIGLKLANYPGYTICFIAGAVLILGLRFYQSFNRPGQNQQ